MSGHQKKTDYLQEEEMKGFSRSCTTANQTRDRLRAVRAALAKGILIFRLSDLSNHSNPVQHHDMKHHFNMSNSGSMPDPARSSKQASYEALSHFYPRLTLF